jgi:hypothetical protein
MRKLFVVACSVVLLMSARVGTAAPPIGQLVVSADGLWVRDTRTGLLWQRHVDTLRYTYGGATAYCASLALGTESGFRLPSIVELATILDESRSNPPIDSAAFPVVAGVTGYWSATTDAANAANAWTMLFTSQGFMFRTDKSSTQNVRCVR